MSPIPSESPWNRDNIKIESIFHFRIQGACLATGKGGGGKMQWYIHCRAKRHAVLCQKKKNYTDNPACSHLTKRDQSIIPLTSLCYSLHRPHYWNNYLQTQKEPHSGLRWEGIDEHNEVRASTWNGFIPIWHPCTLPLGGISHIQAVRGSIHNINMVQKPRLIWHAKHVSASLNHTEIKIEQS